MSSRSWSKIENLGGSEELVLSEVSKRGDKFKAVWENADTVDTLWRDLSTLQEKDLSGLSSEQSLIKFAVAAKKLLTEIKELVADEILDEMDTFIYDKMGKPIHNIGKHDDLLFGAMIALQAHVRCPLSNTYLSSFTGDRSPARGRSLAYANAVDTDDEYDWYEDEFTD